MNTTALDECISRMYPDTCGMPVDAKIWTIIFEGALASIASILGTIFNIASLVVLFDPPSRNLFEQLLISLAFCDLTFLSKLPYNILQDIIVLKWYNLSEKKTFEIPFILLPITVFHLPLCIYKTIIQADLQDLLKSKGMTSAFKVCLPVARVALNASSYITVGMALERVIGTKFAIWPF